MGGRLEGLMRLVRYSWTQVAAPRYQTLPMLRSKRTKEIAAQGDGDLYTVGTRRWQLVVGHN